MTITYDKQVAASYNQQLQTYQIKINNGTITQAELNQAKEIALQYYTYLSQSEIEYGNLAIEVIESSTFYGAFANGMLLDAIQEASPFESETQIQAERSKIIISLALEDSFLRQSDEDGNISSRAIADYHYDVFAIHNLPKEAWGGSIFEEFFGNGSWMEARNDRYPFFKQRLLF